MPKQKKYSQNLKVFVDFFPLLKNIDFKIERKVSIEMISLKWEGAVRMID